MAFKRQRPRIGVLGISLIGFLGLMDVSADHYSNERIGDRNLKRTTSEDFEFYFEALETQRIYNARTDDISCRCEYPNEGVYNNKMPTTVDAYVIKNQITILPPTDPQCKNVWFVCPQVGYFDGTPWSIVSQCPYTGNLYRRTLQGLRGGRLLQDDEGDATTSEVKSFTLLPDDSDFCSQGGTMTQYTVEDKKSKCQDVVIDFENADDGRPLSEGDYVSREWFHTYGIAISAQNHKGEETPHPMLVSSRDIGTRGVDDYGNVLVAEPRSGGKQGDTKYVVLVFDFYNKDTYVNSVSLYNLINDNTVIQILRGDNDFQDINVNSMGLNTLQTISLKKAHVSTLSVAFEVGASIAKLDLCIKI